MQGGNNNVPVSFVIWTIFSELWHRGMVHLPQDIPHTELVRSPRVTLFQTSCFAFTSPGKKAPGPSSGVSQCSFPTANLPGGKAGPFAPGDDDPHSSFTQPAATLATSKEAVSDASCSVLIKLSDLFLQSLCKAKEALTVQVEQQRLPLSTSASCSLRQIGITLRLCQGKCQQGPCPDKDITGSVLMSEMKVLLCCCHHGIGPQLCPFDTVQLV